METTYDISISCFQLISVASTGLHTKIIYSLYENSLTLLYFIIEIAYT